ncbi:MAG: class I SAM-dependent methyltransferase [Myxococcales bacterium]|nr:class I SAM-dependent methyltransferase [Myxococcales bacterium]
MCYRQAMERPERYAIPWDAPFREQIARSLRPGGRVLDVGGGRFPTLRPEQRRDLEAYVGLDVSRAELGAAPDGAYTECVTADVIQRVAALEGRFDLVVSFQVLEHVRPLERALDNLHAYLAPGGTLVAQFSGGRSVFALADRVIPSRLGRFVLERFIGRPPETIFPAHYDRCWYGALTELLCGWRDVEIVPVYWGMDYFRFSRPLQRLYLGYENWLHAGDRRDWAPYYVVKARRADPAAA